MATRVRSTSVLTLTGAAENRTSAYSDSRVVRITPDTDCWVLIGNGAVADVNQFYMPAKSSRDFDVAPLDRISAISAAGAKVYISDLY